MVGKIQKEIPEPDLIPIPGKIRADSTGPDMTGPVWHKLCRVYSEPNPEVMKKYLPVLCTMILIGLPGWGQKRSFSDLVGRWAIAGPENAGAELEIVDSNTIILRYKGDTRRISQTSFDFSRSPSWFDFRTDADSTPILSIVEIIGKDVMKWQLFVEEERSPYFTAKKGELLYLKRKKEVQPVTASAQ